MKKKFFNWSNKYWPGLAVLGLVLIFFYPVWLQGLLPIPADITVGLYYPWLDYKWGYEVGVPVKNNLPADVPSLVYPWKKLVIEAYRERAFPLWNPYAFSGMPLLGNFQSAALSLNNIFYLLFSFNVAWSLGVILQPTLSLIFTYAFLRHIKLSNSSSFLGAIAFAFSGFSLVWLEYNVHGHAMYWLPLMLLATDKIISEGKRSWFFALPIILALQIFAGYPQLVLYSLLGATIFALFRAKQADFRRLFVWAAAVVFGMLLAAPQLLPGLEATLLSVREVDALSIQQINRFLPWGHLVTAIAPDFFGNPTTGNYWGTPYYDNFSLYVGLIPLFLALLSLRKKEALPFVTVAAVGLILALSNPISHLLDKAPLFGNSVSARSLFLFDFAVAVLAAFGLERVKQRKLKAWYFAIPLLALTFLWGLVLSGAVSLFYPQIIENLGVVRNNLILPTGIALGIAVSFIFSRAFPKKLSTKLLISSLIVVAVLDLFRFGWKYLTFTDEKLIFPKTPVIEFLQKQKAPFRVEFGETIPPNMWIPYRLESPGGNDALAPLRYSQFLTALNSGRTDTLVSRIPRIGSYNSPLFDLLNVKYILLLKYDEAGKELSAEGDPRVKLDKEKFELAYEEGTVQVYENRRALPRAYLVEHLVYEEDPQKIFDRIVGPDFNVSKSAVIEDESLSQKLVSAEGDVKLEEYSAQRIRLKTTTPSSSFLVLLNNFYPGWRAYVDGDKAKIFRTNFTFQGVYLPEGEHELVFLYDPPLFKIGILISFSTLVLLGVLFFKRNWRIKIGTNEN